MERNSKELFKRAQAGDKQARDTLIEQNMGLVWARVNEMARRGVLKDSILDPEDLAYEIMMDGLVVAIMKFDVDKGYQFSTYAHHWIMQAAHRCVDYQRNTIRLPVHISEQMTKLAAAREALSREGNLNPSADELARRTNLKPSEVRKLLDLPRLQSLNAPIKAMDNDTVTVEDTVAAEIDVDDEAIESVRQQETKAALDAALSRMPTKMQEVVRLRYGLSGEPPMALAEISKRMGIGRKRIDAMAEAGFKRLQDSPEINNLASHLKTDAPDHITTREDKMADQTLEDFVTGVREELEAAEAALEQMKADLAEQEQKVNQLSEGFAFLMNRL